MTPPSRGPAPLDLRLLVPAVAAWALDVALLWAGAAWWVVGSIAGLAAITGVGLVHRARWRDGRWESLGALGGLTALALALVTISLAAHDAVRTAGLLDEWADGRATVSIVGVIESDPRRVLVTAGARGDGDQVVVRATVLTASGRGLVSHVDAPVLVIGDSTWLGVAWQEGMRATGRLGPGQPGDDVVAVFRAIGPPEVIDEAPGVAQAAAYVRARFREATSGLPADARGLVPALVIGDTSATPIDLTEAMTVAGMSHLSAVSGSNVAIVLAAALGLCRLGGIPRRVRPVVAGLVLAGFVVLARPEPSVIRAAVMGAVGLAGLSTSRRRIGMPALSAAVIALLCWDPWLARSYSFALSVLATLGLLVFAVPWGQRIAALLPPGMRGWGPALAVPAAAQLMCAPVVVLLQGTVSLVAVPANLLADPFVAPATVAGVATALIAVLWTAPAGWVAWVAAMPTLAIAWIARVAAVQPWGSVPWPDGPVGALLLAALGALAVLVGPWARWVSVRRPLAAVAAMAIAASAVAPVRDVSWPMPGWLFMACDVGQGDGLVLSTGPGRAVLVDAGPDAELIDGCLERLGVHTLDALVLTHFHADHVDGLPGVLRGRVVGEILTTIVDDPSIEAQAVREQAAAHGTPVMPLVAGDRLEWPGVQARVWWPARLIRDGSVPNNASVVLTVSVGGLGVVLLGDIEREAARAVLTAMRRDPEVPGWRVDVVKVAHHGSANRDDALLDALAGPIAVVSVGRTNDYGHPAPSTLLALRARGFRVFRTDQDGDVGVGLGSSQEILVAARGP